MSSRKRTYIQRGPSTAWGNVATVSPLADIQALQEETRKVVGYRGVKERDELIEDLIEREIAKDPDIKNNLIRAILSLSSHQP